LDDCREFSKLKKLDVHLLKKFKFVFLSQMSVLAR
jgi:hypothetical protein